MVRGLIHGSRAERYDGLIFHPDASLAGLDSFLFCLDHLILITPPEGRAALLGFVIPSM